MLRRLPWIVGCVAVALSCCFPAFPQALSANAATPKVERPLFVFIFGPQVALKRQRLEEQRQREDCCFCGNNHRSDLAIILATRLHFNSVRPLPEIRVIDLEGLKKLLQRDPKDTRPLLVNFWATWCDGCREEFPDLVKIDNDYRAKGLNFLSVTLDEVSDKTKAADFLKEMKATMPVVLLNVNDPEPAIHAVDEKWDGAMPATFLYDREGKLVFKYFGKIKPAELRAAIDKEVSGKQ
jgi:thiol-disulfide isomerase/thioredoxin